jgi:cobaltochelatase CobN
MCRDGRMMIAGLRFGLTFVGIQPARGYQVDASAVYHDPDLVPPHGYLAFYFWLRHTYGADAVIHVGKHGNLEWLPGKGVGLSSTAGRTRCSGRCRISTRSSSTTRARAPRPSAAPRR